MKWGAINYIRYSKDTGVLMWNAFHCRSVKVVSIYWLGDVINRMFKSMIMQYATRCKMLILNVKWNLIASSLEAGDMVTW
jgi:hypothetical protein